MRKGILTVIGFLSALLFVFSNKPLVFAHDGKPHDFEDLLFTWSFDPLIVISLILSAWFYIRGARRIWRETSTVSRGHKIRKFEACMFALGWLSLFIALVSPLHSWGEVLFSAHMTQHEVLMLISAPLIVLSRPLVTFLWALPIRWRQSIGRVGKQETLQSVWRTITNPFVAWVIHAVALWSWHAPSLFQATLKSDLVHTLQHISFLGSALLFWWALVHGQRGLKGYGAAVLYLFTTSIHSGALGALFTFARTVWYPAYQQSTESWGLTPLEDQQLGGLIMWIPAGVVYIIAGLALFVGWMREAEKSIERKERYAVMMAEKG